MSGIVLSIGLIVKNEARSLEQCLQALTPLRERLPCEVVIADTGSTDTTKEIAARYADQLFDFPWVDDFSAARNAVMDRCSGAWYLSIDADEYLDEDVSELVAFLTGEESRQKLGAFIHIHNYVSADLDKDSVRSFMAPRMVRMDTGIRYSGKVHEHLDIPMDDRSATLYHTALWHDGYVYVGPRDWHKKSQRNYRLLEQELKEKPTKGILYVQIIESSENTNTKMKHVRDALRLRKLNPPEWQVLAPIIYCHGVKTALALSPKEDPEYWADKAKREFPGSPYTQIDVNCVMTTYYGKQEKWEKVQQSGEAYLRYFAKFQRNEYSMASMQGSVLDCGIPDAQISVILYLTEAYYHLEQYESARGTLEKIDVSRLSPRHAEGYLSVVLKLGKKIDLTDLLAQIGTHILEHAPENGLDWDRRQNMRAAVEKAFHAGWNADTEEERPAYQLLTLLNDTVYAPCAHIMLAHFPSEIEGFLSKIHDWELVPPAVFVHILENGVTLPDEFFQQVTFDRMAVLARSLPALLDDFDERTYDYVTAFSEEITLSQSAWRANLILEACAVHDWRKRDEFGIKLYQSCCGVMEQFLGGYYHPQLLENPPFTRLLPAAHMAGLYLMQAEQQRKQGDLVAFVRTLKEMLQKLPKWKQMISFLGDYYAPSHEPLELGRDILEERNDQVSRELLALAQQVKAILDRFPADHPSVRALKMSPAYQKVAKLIEDMD